MKNALAKTCAYAMLVSLIVFGLAGISVQYAHLVHKSFPAFDPDLAQAALLPALMVCFVAASIASMLSAEDAEEAWRAGDGYRKVTLLAIIYTGFCIFIEVATAHYGAALLGLDLSPIALTAILGFFALAPRMLAFVKSGMSAIAREQAENDKKIEHERDMDRLKAVTAETEARIQDGEKRRRFGVIEGAAVSLAALGLAAPEHASAIEPAAHTQTLAETASAEEPEIEFIGERFKARDQVAFDRVMTLRLDGQFNPRQIALRVKAEGHDVSQATVYRWVNAIDREAARDVPLGTMA